MYDASASFRALINTIGAILMASGAVSAQPCQPGWNQTIGAPGMNSPVNALIVGGPANGRFVYAAGRFTTAGGVATSKIARWDGVAWSPLGTGIGGVGPVVNALSGPVPNLGGVLFVGGQFTSAGGSAAGNVARWDGTTWSALGAGLNGPVFAMAVHDDGSGPTLFAGGLFTEAGGVLANNIAKWDGAQWVGLGAGTNGRVNAMTVLDDGEGGTLYVGGEFTMAGASAANRVARWDGLAWIAVGNGFNNSVFALATFDDGIGPAEPELYAGGSFTQNGGDPVSRVSRWDGTKWTALGTGTNATVRTLVAFDDGDGPALYAGGSFTMAGGASAKYVARWNGASWSALGDGLNDSAFALAVDAGVSRVGPALYIGGSFATADDEPSNFVSQWTGCADPPGDMNGDGRLDENDIGPFVDCLTGPGGGTLPGCGEADTDLDGDVDLDDVSAFIAGFAGS